jgi:hypothetical protein
MSTATMDSSLVAFRNAVLALADRPSAGNVARYLAASRAVARLETDSNRVGEQRHPHHAQEHHVPDAVGCPASAGWHRERGDRLDPVTTPHSARG